MSVKASHACDPVHAVSYMMLQWFLPVALDHVSFAMRIEVIYKVASPCSLSISQCTLMSSTVLQAGPCLSELPRQQPPLVP